MTQEEMLELARRNVDAHLGDVVDPTDDEEANADAIYHEAYVLAFDKLADAGVDHEEAREVATAVAMSYAQA